MTPDILAEMKAHEAVASEREQFEAYIAKERGDLTTFGRGENMHYLNGYVNNAWLGWQARASLPQATEALCACKVRPASQCDEEWGPQCDLGNNAAYARVSPIDPKLIDTALKAVEPVPVEAVSAKAVSEDTKRLVMKAARYQWLLDGKPTRHAKELNDRGGRLISKSETMALMSFHYWCAPEELDEAIDAAIAASPSSTGGA